MARDEVHVWVPLESPMQRTHDSESRFVDAPLPTSVAARGLQGPSRRTKIASYFGSSFIAERNPDGSLDIFHVGSGNLPTDLVGDSAKGPMTAARLQQINEASRRRVVGSR